MALSLVASYLAISLAAPHNALTAAPPATDATPLIPRSVLFGNPERANVQLGPFGRRLSCCWRPFTRSCSSPSKGVPTGAAGGGRSGWSRR